MILSLLNLLVFTSYSQTSFSNRTINNKKYFQYILEINNIGVMNEQNVQNQELDKQKMKELEKRKLQQESEMLSNDLRTAFGYSPWLNTKAINYKSHKMQIRPLQKNIEDHFINKDSQLLPLQKLLQEERQRIMVEEKGINTEETIRFFIEKIKEYNSILDMEHIKKLNQDSTHSECTQNDFLPPKNDIMKRYTGDNGQITNFHLVLNWQNLVPVFKELSGDAKYSSKSVPLKRKRHAKKFTQQLNATQPPKKNAFLQKFESKLNQIDQKSRLRNKDSIEEDKNHETKHSKQSIPSEDINIKQPNPEVSASSPSRPNTRKTQIFSKQQSIRQEAKQQRKTKSILTDRKTEKFSKFLVAQNSPTPINLDSPQLEIDKQNYIKSIIDDTFDKDQLVHYLTNKDFYTKAKFKSKILKDLAQDSEKLHNTELIESELNTYLVDMSPQLNSVLMPPKNTELQTQTPIENKRQSVSVPPQLGFGYQLQQRNPRQKQSQTSYPIVGHDDIQRGGFDRKQGSLSTENQVHSNHDSEVSFIKNFDEKQGQQKQPQYQIRTPNLDHMDNYYNQNEQNTQEKRRRQRLIDELISYKQPKFIHPGGTKFAVLNTPENIKMHKMRKTRVEEQLLNEIEKYKQRPIQVQEHMMTNLFVLQGPPKKVEFKTSDLKHDYNDMKVSKMMKHIMDSYK